MRGEWQTSTLGELGTFKNGANYSQNDYGDKFPVATVKNLFRGRYVTTNDLDAIKDGVIKRIDDYLLKRGDLLFARSSVKRSGSGQVALVGEFPENCIFSGFTIRFRAHDESKVLPLYLLYLFRTPQYREEFTRIATGTTIHNLSQATLSSVEIYLPQIEEQKSIAHILGTLDDKIELNRQMNATLEAMAQALFKSWFVDFDPVIDNALVAGNPIPEPLQARAEVRAALGDKRKPLPEAIQKKFPNSFVFSEEMGWIPEGWEVAEIGDHGLEIESGRRPKGGIDKELSQGIPSVGAESICPIGKFDFSKAKMVTPEFAATVRKGWVRDYDVALYKDGGKPGLFKPRVSLYGEGFPYEKFMVNEHVFLLRSQSLGQFFLYYTVASQSFLDQLVAKGSAKAAQPGLNQGEVCDTRFLMPGSGAVASFNRLMAGDVSKRLALGKTSLTLERLRDTLLPKLLSGQLRIPDAEKLVTDAV